MRFGKVSARRLGVLGSLIGAVSVALVPASASAAGPLVQVSQTGTPGTPYASCTALSPGGINYPNAEVEPQVASDPTHPGHLLGVYQQDRWSNGGAHGLVAAWSFDSGAKWARTTLPFSRCAPSGLPYNQASDPWVTFGPDGIAYASAINFDNNTAPALGTGRTAVSVATSTDGGQTWSRLKVVSSNPNGNQFGLIDKESITADPTRPKTAYLVWDVLFQAPDFSSFTGQSWFSKTTDGGAAWSTPIAIASPGSDHSTEGNAVLVDPRDDTLYDFYVEYHSLNFLNPFIRFVKSTNGGATWTAPHSVATLHSGFGVIDPNNGDFIRTGEDSFQESVIDPINGRLYVAWEDNRFSGGAYDEVALSISSDGGQHWSAPRRVNTPTGHAAFTPTLAVAADESVGLSYYDFRQLRHGETTLPTDYWFKQSFDGGLSFGPDEHIAGPFNELAAPYAFGYFLGDYEGLATLGTSYGAFFVQANCTTTCDSNRTDVFWRQL